jgi:hypothetical protein
MGTTTNATLGDDRLRRDETAGGRENRSKEDAERTDKDGTAMSGSERRRSFRDEWTQNALPEPPAIPGYHLCWLSTTNNYDPIHKRMRMGYEPVKAEDVPGFEVYKVKSGEFAGMVACNEMVLFKIPHALYQEMMSYFHHEKPLEEEEMIKKQNEALNDPNAKSVTAHSEDDGFKSIGKPKSAPIF